MHLQFNMLVSYTYRSDDPLADEEVQATPSRKEKLPEMKTFTFYTVVDLGLIIPRVGRVAVDELDKLNPNP